MKKIQRVGVDLDGTVADYIHGLAPLLKEHYNLEPDFSKPAYRIEEVFGLTPELNIPGFREHLYNDLHGFLNLPPFEEDIGDLSWELCTLQPRTEVYVITSRDETEVIVNDTILWLQNQDFIFSDVFFIKDKSFLCEALGIKVMFEDEPAQIGRLLARNIPVVVRNQPWNTSVPEHPLLKRVDNWQQMLEAAKEYL